MEKNGNFTTAKIWNESELQIFNGLWQIGQFNVFNLLG